MQAANPPWSAPRIHGESQKLGLTGGSDDATAVGIDHRSSRRICGVHTGSREFPWGTGARRPEKQLGAVG